jgi:hypothetical protein
MKLRYVVYAVLVVAVVAVAPCWTVLHLFAAAVWPAKVVLSALACAVSAYLAVSLSILAVFGLEYLAESLHSWLSLKPTSRSVSLHELKFAFLWPVEMWKNRTAALRRRRATALLA